jgi:hypothetical protein
VLDTALAEIDQGAAHLARAVVASPWAAALAMASEILACRSKMLLMQSDSAFDL